MLAVARLVLARGGAGTICLRPGEYRVGRVPDCDVFLNDPTVSRFHATLSVASDSATVRDNRSRNGTFVDGKRIETASLEHGAALTFGEVPCLFERLMGGVEDPSTLSGAAGPHVGVPELSQAERRVFEGLIHGLAEKAIAVELSISRHTVHNHVKRIYQAFDVHTRSELLTYVLSGRNGK